jgi:6-phosphogluconolactonase/glucosamine-6-phosphate isomerase/deaminase
LCMFCGATGHTADNCPKSTSAASKANRSLWSTHSAYSVISPTMSDLQTLS